MFISPRELTCPTLVLYTHFIYISQLLGTLYSISSPVQDSTRGFFCVKCHFYSIQLPSHLWCKCPNPFFPMTITYILHYQLIMRWGCCEGSSEGQDGITRETKTFYAYYNFSRSNRWRAVAVFVGLDMSNEKLGTLSPAEWMTWE